MATYTNSNGTGNLNADLGSPSLSDGDTVRINDLSSDYTNGMDLSSAKLALLEVTPGYAGNIGFNGKTNAASTPLKMQTNTTGIVRLMGSGRWANIVGGGLKVLHQVEVQPAADQSVILGDCTIDLLYVKGGAVLPRDDAAVTAAYVCAGGLSLLESSNAITTAGCAGSGSLTLRRAVTTLHCAGGVVDATYKSLGPTTINLYGGTVKYGGGNVTNLNAWGGTLDLTQLSAPITITNANFYGPTEIVLKKSDQGKLTLTNTVYAVQPTYRYV